MEINKPKILHSGIPIPFGVISDLLWPQKVVNTLGTSFRFGGSVPSSPSMWRDVEILLDWIETKFPPTPFINGWNMARVL